MSISIDKFDRPRYINYLSFSKVDNIYSQIVEMQLDNISKKRIMQLKFRGILNQKHF